MKNGLKNGLLLEYFENGDIKSEQNWVQDLLNGKFTDYYEGGLTWRKGEYRENKRFGEWTYYNKDRTIFQTQFYDSLGDIEDVIRFLPNGKRDLRPFPYIYINSPEFGDTLGLNESHTLHVKIVNISDTLLLPDDLVLTNGLELNKSGRTVVVDTIAIINPQRNFKYHYEFVPGESGSGKFLGLVYSKKDHRKTTEVITMGFSYPIFVTTRKTDANVVHHATMKYE